MIGGDYDPRVCGAACAFQHGGPLFIIYQSQRNPHHDALANALTRLQILETFLIASDTSLVVVGVLVATHRADSGKSFLSYSLHPFRVMGIVMTRATDAGMSSVRISPPAIADYSMNSFQGGCLPTWFNNQLYEAEVGRKFCNSLL